MLSEYASNSILAIVRSKYGSSLTAHDFEEMAALHSVGEIFTYLATRTKFADALENLSSENVNRSLLENALRGYLFKEISGICSFEKAVGEQMFYCVQRRYEVTDLLNFIRLMLSGSTERFVFHTNNTFKGLSAVNFERLILAKSYEAILDCVADRNLKRILSVMKPSSMEKTDFTMIEALLINYLFDFEKEVVLRESHGQAQKELLECLDIRADMANIKKIYRVNKFFSVTNELLQSELISSCGRMKQERIRRLITAPDEKELLAVLKTTVYGRYFEGESVNVEYVAERILNSFYKRKIRMTRSPAVSMFCYLGLMDTEISNITTVIEGVRYNSPPERIAGLLCFA